MGKRGGEKFVENDILANKCGAVLKNSIFAFVY